MMRPRTRWRAAPWQLYALALPALLRPPLSLTRAQVSGVESSATAADGATLALFGADTARFNGQARRLLIEGQRTNSHSNPRGEGAVVGTPGTVPTGWAFDALNGLSTAIVATGAMGGIPYVDVRFSGTTTSTFAVLRFSAPIATSTGQTWSQSTRLALVGGSRANINSLCLSIRGNASMSVNEGPNVGALSATEWRLETFTSTTVLATTIAAGLALLFNSGVAIDITVRIGGVQIENAAFASSLILPPVGTPGASTRGADIVTATLASLGVPASGACTVLWSGVVPVLPPAGSGNFHLLHLDAGDNNNRVVAFITAGSSNLSFGRTTAGVFSGGSVGAISAATAFRFGVTIDGAGRGAMSLNGGAASVITGAPTNYTTLRLGATAVGENMHGETAAFRVLPYVLSDTDLAAAVAAMPT
jgi:hypothetical protein